MRNSFLFSVVTAAYNVELFLAEAIESIIKQTIGFKKNIQLILVDDGSTDGTGNICDKYQKKYPKNIVVIHKENGGVSSARNAGIEVATGKYINFLDADDKFSRESFANVYKFFEQHYDETDIVTVPIYYFDGKSGEHYLNWKFKKGSRVIDLQKEPKQILKNVNATFFRKDRLASIKFDTNLAITEDIKFCCELLLNRLRLGVCSEAKYLYRERQAGEKSAIQGKRNNRRNYLEVIENFHEYLIWTVKKLYAGKPFPAYFQYLIMSDLFWRLKGETAKPECLTDDEWEEYKTRIKKISTYLNDDYMSKYELLYVDHRTFLLYCKHGYYPSLINTGNDCGISYHGKDKIYSYISKQFTRLEILQIKDNVVHVEGYLRFVGVHDDLPIQIFISASKKNYYGKTFTRNESSRMRYDIPLYRDVGFSIDVPLDDWGAVLQVYCNINNVNIARTNIDCGKYFPVSKKYKESYYYVDHWLVTISEGKVRIADCGRKGHILKELALLKELIKNKKWQSAVYRLIYYISLKKRRPLWILSDRIERADDNGEVFFEYLSKNKKHINSIFIIGKQSKDKKRIKHMGKCVAALGKRHKLFTLICDMIVSSGADEFIIHPLSGNEALKDLIVNKKVVFLQHGVISNDLSSWLNKYEKNLYKFVTSTKAEYNSILEYDYFYDENTVILTGLPRFDKLYNNPKKQIVIIPTWRKYLAGTSNNGEWSGIDDFKESDYYKFYSSLINNEKLIKTARKYGYQLALLLHPIMYQCYGTLFKQNANVEFLDVYGEYRDVFAESDLLVTDYSSVAFDFAYLRKPVIYCQFDREQFYSGAHSYSRGYFSFEDDGFGEVCLNLQQTIDVLIEYIKTECKIKEKYLNRINKTFPYHDKKCCDRVFNNISK